MLTGSPALSFSLPLIAFFARSLFRSSSLTESLEQANSQVIVSGVPSRRENKGTPDRRLAEFQCNEVSRA